MPASPTARLRRWGWIGAVVALAVVLWLVAGAFAGPRVPTLRVERRALVQRVIANGRVWVPARVQLGTMAAGVVARLNVDEGSRVAPAETLLALANAEQRAAVAQAAAAADRVRALDRRTSAEELRQANVASGQAERRLRRAEDLARGGATAREDLDSAREEHELAQSRLAAAGARARASAAGGTGERAADAVLAAAQARLDQTRILAPAAGTIIERRVAAGDVVQAGQVLLVMARADSTWLSVQPEEKSLAYLRVGQEATASTDAFPQLTFRAVVARISPAVDANRGTVDVRLRVPEPPDYLRPDMTVSIDVAAARKDGALALPAEAVRDADSPAPWVLALRGGRAARVPVTLGLRGAGLIEIASGLAEGDAVVPSTAGTVRAGQRARAGS